MLTFKPVSQKEILARKSVLDTGEYNNLEQQSSRSESSVRRLSASCIGDDEDPEKKQPASSSGPIESIV